MARLIQWISLACVLLELSPFADAQSAEYWDALGRSDIRKALEAAKLNTNVAKNVILFVGDGMDITTITAARILKGQKKGNPGEEEKISWEEFSHAAFSKTYNTDRQVADSAGTATAMFSGVKTKYEVIGVDETIELDVCPGEDKSANIDSFFVSAQDEGKATGFVSTARVTHATPASLYAHSASRYWEDDSLLPVEEAAKGCVDIAVQLLTEGRDIQVILGGGRRTFLSNTTQDPEYANKTGNRQDGRNLVEEWMELHKDENSQYVWNKEGFDSADYTQVDYLLGLFEPSHMQYEEDRSSDGKTGEPSIAEMTGKAIEILSKNEQGFILMVEGGRIDHAHHEGIAHRALTDTLALDEAVTKAISLVNTEDTLVIVTADHAHSMTMTGYPSRGNPIFGINDKEVDIHGIPFSTLGYYNGPGAHEELKSINETGYRRNLTEEETSDPDFLAPAIIATEYENHGGQDVGIFATGPQAHLFHSVHEQNYIAHVVRYAACIGEYSDCVFSGAGHSCITSFTSIIIALFIAVHFTIV